LNLPAFAEKLSLSASTGLAADCLHSRIVTLNTGYLEILRFSRNLQDLQLSVT